MQKKVGIITFHLSINYGAVLQCYALQHVLSSQGMDVEVIDYHPDFNKRGSSIIYRNPFLNKLRKWYIELREFSPQRYPWRKKFSKFVKTELKLSKRCSYKSIPATYDYYVVGSDQMWNYKITGELHPAYFADFQFDKGSKKYISYAVSMEETELRRELHDKFIQYLNNFDAISVREETLQRIIQPLTEKIVYRTVDPVLLANRSLWEKFAIQPKMSERYVLVYQVRYCPDALRIARDIAEQIGAIVIELASNMNAPFAPETLGVQTPAEFVGWFKNAECIVTTSFHGTVYSMTFEKPFYMVNIGDGWDSRMVNLMHTCGLEERIVHPDSKPIFGPIDYMQTNCILQNMRQDSLSFINTFIN